MLERLSTMAKCLVAFLVFLAVSTNAQPSAGLWQVLVLHSYHRGMLWADEVVTGLLDVLGADTLMVDLRLEFMDTRRYPSEEHRLWLRGLYEDKYPPGSVDAVVVLDDPALDFFLQHREELFAELPAVFGGINFLDGEKLRAIPNLTGVLENFDLEETLAQALQLHPQRRHLFVVNDRSRTGQANRTRVLEVLPNFPSDLRTTFLEDLGMDRLEDSLARLPSDALVLLLTYNWDGYGDFFRYREVVRRVSAASTAPVYGVWTFYMGRGIVGGKLLDGRAHGAMVGNMMRRILKGESVAVIPLDTAAQGQWIFDYTQMQRWGISETLLPAQSIIRGMPRSIWHVHRELVILVAGALIVLSLLVLILSWVLLAKHRVERSLRLTEERMRAIFDQSFQLSGTVDLKGNLTAMNRAAMEFSGARLEDVIGRPFWEGPWWREDSAGQMRLRETIRNAAAGQVCRFEALHRDGQGALHQVDFSIRPVKDSEGVVQFLVAEGVDITARRRSEAALDNAVRELEAKNRELEQILYVASHDLRSPLVNIQGYSSEILELLEDIVQVVPPTSLDPPAQAHFLKLKNVEIPQALDFILRGVRKMDSLLAGLLRLSRLGKQALRLQLLDMNHLLSEVVLLQHYQLEKTQVTVDLQPLPPCWGDAVQINQVFSNLLDNAIKYRSPDRPGRVRISGRLEGAVSVYEIADNGLGIAKEHQPKIFEIFHRLNPGASEGEGLGLNIVQRILDRHEGRVQIHSMPGEGTRFDIYLPAAGS